MTALGAEPGGAFGISIDPPVILSGSKTIPFVALATWRSAPEKWPEWAEVEPIAQTFCGKSESALYRCKLRNRGCCADRQLPDEWNGRRWHGSSKNFTAAAAQTIFDDFSSFWHFLSSCAAIRTR
jgi:hypothetical protein